MIICFRCSSESKQAMDRLIQSGHYEDYSEVVAFAVANLAVLQEELIDGGILVIGEAKLTGRVKNRADENLTKIKGKPRSGNISIRHSKGGDNRKTPDKHRLKRQSKELLRTQDLVASAPLDVPYLFQIEGIHEPPLNFPNLPADVWVAGQEVPLDRWLFGQYNKLLPAKANCRALCHLLKIEPDGVPLSIAATEITEHVFMLSDYLQQQDAKNAVHRDDAFSTAFPTNTDQENGDNPDKGRSRYANHFIASVNANGRLSGLLIDLKLINYVKRKDPLLQLTEAGWHFATIPNPALDSIQDSPIQKFSSEERIFLLEHIRRFVPTEDFAYCSILRAILEGANTPESLDRALLKYAPEHHNFTASFLSSQRSGAISRMSDLGLVERVREGVRVSYLVTSFGKAYVESVNSPVLGNL